MKKIIILIVLLQIQFNSYSQATIYHNFPSSDAMWREYSGGYQCNCCDNYQYIITGDTLIGSYIYHKLQQSGVHYYENTFDGSCTNVIQYYYNGYIGAFREDSINKKLFFFTTYPTPHDTLLYDFDLELGDTLRTSFINDSALTLNIVSSIDSVLVGNIYHKQFGISSSLSSGWTYTYLIEGIGCTYGLIPFLYPQFESFTSLLCFQQNGLTLYPDTTYSCDIVTNIENNQLSDFIYSIYPNPISTYATIELSDRIVNSDLYIYDIYGKEIIRYSNLQKTNVINRNDLASGLYFYYIIHDNKTFAKGKLIIL